MSDVPVIRPDLGLVAHLRAKQLRYGDVVLVRSDVQPSEANVSREIAGDVIEGESGARCVGFILDEQGCLVLRMQDLRLIGLLVAKRGAGGLPVLPPIVYPPDVRNAWAKPERDVAGMVLGIAIPVIVLIGCVIARWFA